MSLLGLAALLLFVAVTLQYLRSSAQARVRYPPGPKGLFLLNNLLDMPRSRGWLTFTSWKEKYGGLIFLRVLGKNILVINSREDAIALLEKRSGIYSDRPDIPVASMTDADFNSAALRYSDKWRQHRKVYQQFLRPPMTPTFQPAQRMKVHALLRDFLSSPEHFMEHYRTLSAGIIMKILYDIDISPSTGDKQDHYVEVAEEADNNLNKLALACTILPTLFRLISYIPSWIPILGALDRLIKETKLLHHKMMTEPFNVALNNSNPSSCVSMRLLSYSRDRGGGLSDEYIIREICATAYAAGAETTVSSMGTFLLAMLKFPEVQRKAQKEIDDVIGNRLPEYEDRKSLPYVEAVYREVMRWKSVTPLGIPHMNTVDDVYNGCFIPKRTIILPNVWAMNHDPSTYTDPDQFKPERFFNDDGELNDDMADLTFGFGRRLCPGRHMASATVWMTIVSVLSVFSIQPAKDEYGNEIPVPGRYTNATISHPEPFKCSISPRSDLAKDLILGTA